MDQEQEVAGKEFQCVLLFTVLGIMLGLFQVDFPWRLYGLFIYLVIMTLPLRKIWLPDIFMGLAGLVVIFGRHCLEVLPTRTAEWFR